MASCCAISSTNDGSISPAVRGNRPRVRKNPSSTAKPSWLPWCLVMTSARSGGVSLDRSRAGTSLAAFNLGGSVCQGEGHDSLQNPHSVKSAIVSPAEIRGVSMVTTPAFGRQNVKSVPAAATDAHERGKDFLSDTEIAALLDAAKAGRHGVRDHLLILAMFRHGLRVSEAIGLRRDEVDLDHARLWIRRLKNGLAVEHPIAGDELRAIKRYLATRTDSLPWLFVSEREQPLARQSVNYLIATAARRAELPPVHPHMLRHSCGFYLANRGYDLRLIQDYLGHRDPKHTVHYTRVAGSRFEGLWR
jgi:type 1 fimbriae regulatory protein FimB